MYDALHERGRGEHDAGGEMTERLYQITAGHFCAGIAISDRGLVTAAAPIVAYMAGWTERRVMNYVRQKAWRIAETQPHGGQGEEVTR